MNLFELQDRPEQDKNFDRNQMPQIRQGNLQNSPFKFEKGKISLAKLKPVQSQRVKGMHDKAKKGFADGSIRPIVIDKHNYIVNGHHRYDVARGMDLSKVRVLKVDATIEDLIAHFTDTASPEPTYEETMKAKVDSLLETIEASQDISALMKGIEADLKQRDKDLKRLPKKSIYEQAKGDCYQANGMAFMKNTSPTARLIHGDITPRLGAQQGRTYGHAWIEDGDKLVDHTTKGTNVMDYIKGFDDMPKEFADKVSSKSIFYGMADPKNIKKYNKKTFHDMIGKHKHWGAWSSVERMNPFEDIVDGNFPIQQRDKEFNAGMEREIKMHKVLERLAQMWWNNDEDPAVEKKLADMGWDIGEDEGSDTPSVYVVMAGDDNGNSYTSWPIDQLENDVVENFKDGKVKGKSKPGRVNKAGASCNGSVTSLRKKAKNSSGEKAKMYHWCANMKAGKKKS